jgi:hypothetical protein
MTLRKTTRQPDLIDLSGPVTREQFTAAITASWPVWQELRRRENWCQDWLIYLRAISPVYPRYAGEQPDLSKAAYTWPVPYEDLTEAAQDRYSAEESTFYQTALTQFRRRVLYYAKIQKGGFTLGDANTVFTAMGLPEYSPPSRPAEYYIHTRSALITVSPEFQGDVGTVLRDTFRDALPEGIAVKNGYQLITGVEPAVVSQIADEDCDVT